ncbi:MAG: hypothetical protein QOE11_3626 [Solirubrobacteraceae bacterium]|jgi:hypothetical protein|nr:hypothetical protein [Solirubrobacteraceae bacterium]
MRARVALSGTVAAAALLAAAAAAQAPAPAGNFGGGGLVGGSHDHFGPGNAVVALRALPGGKLEIEATARGACGGGDITTDATVADDGSFSADGRERTQPAPGVEVTTTFSLMGTFSGPTAADGTLTATIKRTAAGRTSHCHSGRVTFSVRRPDGVLGKPGAAADTLYYGTTSQRGVGPRRPIVLRVSSSGRVVSSALFGESVHCSDDTDAIGLEAPRTNAPIDAKGRVDDHERFTINSDTTDVRVNDRFTAQFGADGARGTFSLSDRTTDKTTHRTLRTCASGVVKWTAAP